MVLDRKFAIRLFLILAVLQILDIITTFIAIKYTGAVETNPHLAEYSLRKLLLIGSVIKIFGLVALSFVFFVEQKGRFFANAVQIVYVAILFLVAFYFYILINNVKVILNGIY